MTEWRHYHQAGLSIASETEIPDWACFVVSPCVEPDVSIAVSAARSLAGLSSSVLPGGEEIRIVIPDIAAFEISRGTVITILPAIGTPARQWLPFLLGTAWNALCVQRGLLLIHASAVRIGESAFAFCGESGSGKSTTAANLTRRGFSLVSDDLCRIDHAAMPLIYPSAPRFRLWSDSVRGLGHDPENFPKVLDGRDKHFVPPSSAFDKAPARLQGIFLLEWGEPEIRRLTGLAALSRLVREATYRPSLIEQLSLTGRHWGQFMDLLKTVPVAVFSRPRDPARLEAALDLLRLPAQAFV